MRELYPYEIHLSAMASMISLNTEQGSSGGTNKGLVEGSIWMVACLGGTKIKKKVYFNMVSL